MAFPGPLSAAVLKELARYVIADPYPFAIDLEKSHGMYLVTLEGTEIFDWSGCYGSKLLGHNHPGLSEPNYCKRLLRAANNKLANPDFLTKECVDFYRTVYELAPRCMQAPMLEVYAVNSGAEAVENMMKYFINLHEQKLRSKAKRVDVRRFIYFDQAFHGRTVFALNITQLAHDPVVTRDFAGIVPGNIQVPFPAVDTSLPHEDNLARTEESVTIVRECLERYGDEVVGIIVEPIQGAGGHRVALPQFFQRLSELAHNYKVSLGFDEVQTAGGQTGTVFAIDQFNLPHSPQAVAVAKKFGNGVVYMRYPMEDLGVLDSTWGGNLADMVRFVREMEIVVSEKLIEAVPRKAAMLVSVLRGLVDTFPEVLYNVRGMGLYQGISFRNARYKNALLDSLLSEENTLLLSAGVDSIRFRPPLSVTEEEIQKLGQVLARAIGTL